MRDEPSDEGRMVGDNLLVVEYDESYRRTWNDFNQRSRNGTFLFDRGFVEYHADRFVDSSLLVFEDGVLRSLLPASVHLGPLGREIRSHGGLTYGGLVYGESMSAAALLRVMQAVLKHFRSRGIQSFLYKPVPHIYHRIPAEEDLYALYREGFQLVRRDVASALGSSARARIAKGRKWGIKRSRDNSVEVAASNDWVDFMAMEEELLASKYGAKPAHKPEELALLQSRFPESIRLFTAKRGGELLAGAVIFDCQTCAHVQYIASNQRGRELHALDALFSSLLYDVFADKLWFDFGISSESNGAILNEGLSRFKESWGARSIVYDHYQIYL